MALLLAYFLSGTAALIYEVVWTRLLTQGMARGVFPVRDAHLLGQALLGLIVSVWRWYRPTGATTLSEVSESIEGCCVRMVTA